MPKENNAKKAAFEDCIEECYLASKLCYEKSDGTPVCPFDFEKCADDCRRRFLA